MSDLLNRGSTKMVVEPIFCPSVEKMHIFITFTHAVRKHFMEVVVQLFSHAAMNVHVEKQVTNHD